MNKSKNTTIQLLSIVSVLFTAYVGPGFASGAQTVTYFLTKGWIGVFLGPLFAGILCFVFTFLLFEINRVFQPDSSREAYRYIYKNKYLQAFFANFKEVQVVAVILIALSANISTVGILLHTVFGLNQWIGSILFILLVLSLSSFGANVLRKAGSTLAICVLAVCIYIGVTVLPSSIEGMQTFVNERISYTQFGYNSGVYAWVSMLMIVVFFMNGYDACVPASKGLLRSRKDVFFIALVSAGLSTVTTIVFTVIFAAGMPDVLNEQIPTLWAMTHLNSSSFFIQILYVFFAVAAMTSSSMSFLFTVSERFEKPLGNVFTKSSPLIRKLSISLLFVIICTSISSFGLLNIIKYGYNIFTLFVGPVMFLPLIIAVPYRLKKTQLS